MFSSVITDSTITTGSFLLCFAVSIVLGLGIALAYSFTTKKHSAGFVATLAMIPAVVQIVILLVNGNLGVGVAVAGAFSLIRFRSLPGTAKEIGAIFIGLATGLATGMGYIAFAAIFAVVMVALLVLYSFLKIGDRTGGKKLLTIVIPENVNYDSVFDGIFEKYTKDYELIAVKTTNMGSLFKLSYEITMKDDKLVKKMIDEIRCRNANLEISCNRLVDGDTQL